MEDAAKAYAEENEGVEIEYYSCQSPSDVDCQIAQIEDAVVKGFDAMVITPMGTEVIPAMDAAVDDGMVVVLADNDLDDFTKKTAVAATDNVKGGQAAGEYLKSILKSGDKIGLIEGVRGVPALDARIQGVTDALEGTGVEVIIGGADSKCDAAQGATVAEDLLTRAPDLTAIYSACDDPAIAAAKVAKRPGQGAHRRRLRRPARRGSGHPGWGHDGHDRAVPRSYGGAGCRCSRQRRAWQSRRTVHRHRHRARHERERRAVPRVPVSPDAGHGGRTAVTGGTAIHRSSAHASRAPSAAGSYGSPATATSMTTRRTVHELQSTTDRMSHCRIDWSRRHRDGSCHPWERSRRSR